jgi:hypothetical protein
MLLEGNSHWAFVDFMKVNIWAHRLDADGVPMLEY